jgi:hypothetical protein
MMGQFAIGCFGICNQYSEMRRTGETLTEFEHMLYEAASSYLTTFLKFQRVIVQASVIEAESKLDEKVD